MSEGKDNYGRVYHAENNLSELSVHMEAMLVLWQGFLTNATGLGPQDIESKDGDNLASLLGEQTRHAVRIHNEVADAQDALRAASQEKVAQSNAPECLADNPAYGALVVVCDLLKAPGEIRWPEGHSERHSLLKLCQGRLDDMRAAVRY